MTGGEHPACRGIIAAVAAVIRRVAEEDAPSCARRELVGSGGSEIGVAGTSENSK